MGREIVRLAPLQNVDVVATVDPAAPEAQFDKIVPEALKSADVVLEFTSPDAVLENIQIVCRLGKNLVVGTTGWYEHINLVKELVQDTGVGLVYSANFSLGVNIFYRIVSLAARLLGQTGQYDPFCHEFHHKGKQDSPSGTARKLAQIIVEEMKEKEVPVFETLNRKIATHEFHVTSTRAGFYPGTHIVGFDSEFDTIELTHTLRSRAALALGALKAAQWIKDRKGFFSFCDLLAEQLGLEQESLT
jgi:4-hydroxy-tetrahydrodipicolinate reductase